MKKLIIKGVVFLALLGICVVFLNRLIGIDKSDSILTGQGLKQHEELYELEENSVDVLYLGSSHLYTVISPEDIYHEYGITGFVLGSSCQSIWQSYFYLKEALQTQTPRVVVVEALRIPIGWGQEETYNRMAIDPMKWSDAKKDSIAKAQENNINERFSSYILPILRYHDKWEDLTETDYYYSLHNYDAFAKGFSPRFGENPAEFDETVFTEATEGAEVRLCDESTAYMNRIKALCDSIGAQLVLIKTPTCSWSNSYYQMVRRWAEENDVAYFDFNADSGLREALNIDWTKDSLDGGNHLNYSGAKKVTAWMGEYLDSQFAFEKTKSEAVRERWEQDYASLSRVIENREICEVDNFDEYLTYISNAGYVACITNRGADLADFSVLSDFLQEYGAAGNVWSELTGAEVEQVLQIDALKIRLHQTYNSYLEKIEYSCIFDKEEVSMDRDGVQIIVFDPTTNSYLDTTVWTCEDGKILGCHKEQ